MARAVAAALLGLLWVAPRARAEDGLPERDRPQRGLRRPRRARLRDRRTDADGRGLLCRLRLWADDPPGADGRRPRHIAHGHRVNFAASAALSVSWNGQLVASATTDAQGAVSLSFTVPQVGAGQGAFVFSDARSRYPVSASFVVR
jgi:hypothetical protein